MTDRYYLPDPVEGEEAILPPAESHHFLRVMRGRVGDGLTLFDGRGAEARAEALAIEGGRVRVRMGERREVSREASRALDIAVAVPKGNRMEAMVRSLTELGVRRVLPMICARGAVRPRPGGRERWGRAVVEASKQCGRNLLMEVDAPLPFREVLEGLGEYGERLIPHPEAEIDLAGRPGATEARATAVALVGPEGGFVSAEIGAALAAGFVAVRLAPSTLRIETAAVALASALLVAR